MATVYTDAVAGRVTAWPLQGRTDNTGTLVTGEHFDGKDAGIILPVTAGVKGANHFQVAEDSPTPGMTVVVGSGSVGDAAYLEGDDPLQPVYAVGWTDATTDVSVPAADLSNPRVDEVWLVVQDDQYDSSGNVLPRLAYRDGTPASSPSAPGPDSAWTAALKLATIDVAAGASEITDSDITDERVGAKLQLANGSSVGPGDIGFGNIEIVAASNGVLFYQGSTLLASLDEVDLNMFGRAITNVGDVDGVDISTHSHNGTDSAALSANSVGNTQMGNAAVDTAELVDGAVTAPKLGPDAVTRPKINGQAVDEPQIATDAVWGRVLAEVDDSTEVSSQALTASFADVASVTLSIPAGWGSWKCVAWATWAGRGTSSGQTYGVRLVIDGASQQGITDLELPDPATNLSGAITSRRTGMTTTGSRTVALQGRWTDTTGPSMQDVTLYARAVRTS